MAESSDPIEQLHRALGEGDAEAQGEILAGYRRWLEVLARMQMETRFQAKFDASDVVQQTLLEAHRDLPAFRGTTEAELLAWLRKILAHALAHEEIARKMDRGVGAVRMLWVRALARLREIAGELEGGWDASAGR